MLVDMEVLWLGQQRRLRDVVPGFSVMHAAEVLSDTICFEEFVNFKEFTPLDIYKQIQPPGVLYLNRIVSNRLKLNPATFQKDSKDIFVFKGISRVELSSRFYPHVIRSSSEQLIEITSRHIYLNDDEDWEDLVAGYEFKPPIHLLSCEEREFILLRSTKSSPTILTDASFYRSSDASMTEDDFEQMILCDMHCRGLMICDLPGTGKTWFLKNMSSNMQKHENILAYFVSLSEFGKFLNTLDDHDSKTSYIQHFFTFASKSNVVGNLMCFLDKVKKKKVLLFLDGFDEMHDSDIAPTVKFITGILDNFKNFRICLSSRPHARAIIESTFLVTSYDILPFSKNDQIQTLAKIWKQKRTECLDKKLKEFAEYCYKTCLKIHDQDEDEFLGAPLRCYMFASIAEQHAMRYSEPNRKKDYPLTDVIVIDSIFGLFKEYMKTAMGKILDVCQSTPETESLRQFVISFHVKEALNLLFPSLASSYSIAMRVPCLTGDFSKQVNRMGVITIQDEKYCFVHRRFAEYFVSEFFAAYWNRGEIFDLQFRNRIEHEFFNGVLQTKPSGWKLVHTRRSVIYFELKEERFVNRSLVWFVNKLLQRNSTYILTNELDVFLKRIQICLLCSVKENLTPLLILLKSIIEMVETESLRAELLMVPISHVTIRENSVTLIADRMFNEYQGPVRQMALPLWTTLHGSPEGAAVIFELLNWRDLELSLEEKGLFSNMPSKWDLAIDRNNLDMVVFFLGRFQMPNENILNTCVLGRRLTGSQLERRCEIIQEFISKDPSVLETDLQLHSEHHYSFSFGWCGTPSTSVMKFLTVYYKYKWNRTQSPDVVRSYFRHIFQHGNEQDLVDGLLLFFVRDNILASINGLELMFSRFDEVNLKLTRGAIAQTAQEILEHIDPYEANALFWPGPKTEIFLEGPKHTRYFTKLNSELAITLLTAIIPDISFLNTDKMTWLHFALWDNTIDWLTCLLSAGYNVHKRDKNGSPPLHVIQIREDYPQMLRCLLKHGADINVTNRNGQNLGHIVFKKESLENCLKLFGFLESKGFFDIWVVNDMNQQTPIKIISNRFGKRGLFELELEHRRACVSLGLD